MPGRSVFPLSLWWWRKQALIDLAKRGWVQRLPGKRIALSGVLRRAAKEALLDLNEEDAEAACGFMKQILATARVSVLMRIDDLRACQRMISILCEEPSWFEKTDK